MDTKTRYKAMCYSYYLLFGTVGFGILPALIKSFEDTYSLSHTQIGILMGVGSILHVVASLVAGFFFDRHGPRLVLIWTMALCVFSAFSISVASTTLVFAVALLLFHFSNGLGVVVNPLVGNLYDKERTRGMNFLHAFQGGGRLLAPMVVAMCMW